MISAYDSAETPDVPLSPSGYGDSQLGDDEVYPCKGCGEILEEGKAFELAGNRWHIDCFRCNTCGILLDSDANLLLLGDGSLICNNCTYSCNACGNKIEDMAILTGDQAFCANCFRCKSCTKKIDNLRYARTANGIFCMACHESVIQKRRKNRNKQKQLEGTTRDKKLPDLPAPASISEMLHSAYAPENLDTPPEKKPGPLPLQSVTQSETSSRDRSPTRPVESQGMYRSLASSQALTQAENPILPASTFSKSRSSASTPSAAVYDVVNELNGFFVPLALDQNHTNTGSRLHSPDSMSRRPSDSTLQSQAKTKESSAMTRDYLTHGLPDSKRSSREQLRDPISQQSRSSSGERRNAPSPHVSQQEKFRATDSVLEQTRKRTHPPLVARNKEPTSTPTYPGAKSEFRLQEAPRSRKEVPRRDSNEYSASPAVQSPSLNSQSTFSQAGAPFSTSPTDAESKGRHHVSNDVFGDRLPDGPPPRAPRVRAPPQVERPARGDSLAANRKDGQGSGTSTPHISELSHGRQASSSSQINGNSSFNRSLESSSIVRGVYEPTSSRSVGQGEHANGGFPVSRHMPLRPAHKPTGSIGTGQSDANDSPLHTNNFFGLDGSSAASARDDNHDGSLRKMTNSMRGHARSASDRAGASPRSQRWLKSPINGSVDLGSPTSSVGHDSREETIILRSQLRRAQQRIAELETQRHSLQTVVDGSSEMTQVNSALKEKRSTIAILDTQREVVVRELEIMTEHLQKVKESNKPMEITTFQSEVLNDFAGSLRKLKSDLTSDIEGLVQKRNDLNDEITTLIQMKDKGFQEYENLSNRNMQLTQHNHELLQGIQEMMKSSKQTNGLGLYLGSSTGRDRTDTSSSDIRQNPMDSSSTFVPDNESDAGVLNTPQIVKMKQQKPTMLRKGGLGKTLRGIKGALVSDKPDRVPAMQGESIGMPYNFAHHTDANVAAARQPMDQSRNFRQFFGGSGDKNGGRHLKAIQNESVPSLGSDIVPPSQLFGSDLGARCDFEKRVIPAIVNRCIEEVEQRGMDAEGVYRKSGGSGQVNQLKAGFEVSSEYDISDPELEIHAVTSCLKQYLRRLPVPLITFEVYDYLLDASRAEETEKRALQMRDAVDRLPKAHRDCLEFLVLHLARVTSHEKDNLMTTLNLAVVFAPTIMRPASIEREMMDMQNQRQAVQSLIELYKTIFQVPA